MELWGGHECTVNRVGDRYRDQTRLTGHHDRIEDLARFASLGIRKLRYPVLWERVAPSRPDDRDWTWSDERLAEVERLGMEPIVGLLHHGSGPSYTSLIADDFVEMFASHAAATAQRYPYVTDWTPVNEPLTTARFSTLYGLWYPHARDEHLFWKALLNQVDGTRMAMKAIRRANPAARLVQTEDLGQYYSTEALAATAEHFNHRRWATWDLLTGQFTPDHPLWSHVASFGFAERLRSIADDPCPPDVIGVNYYPTSERFLDHRADRYAEPMPDVGYHDLAAARVIDPPAPGLQGLMRQAWDRYGVPLALTESHLGCTREEQLRWLWQSWKACEDLAQTGVDIVGFTAWALLGNVDWNSLITVEAGHYEPGAFDVRSVEPRPTAIAKLLNTLGAGVPPPPEKFPLIESAGWWQRKIRLEHSPFPHLEGTTLPKSLVVGRPIILTGATGTLGQALARECEMRGIPYLLTDRATLPIDDQSRVAAFLDKHRPWAVINAAGWVRVDDAEERPDDCFRANAMSVEILASACAERGIHLTIFSSDLVFDGNRLDSYVETDRPRPLNVYGHSKAQAEAASVGKYADMLAIRTAAFFSPHDDHNFAMGVETALRDGRQFAASAEAVITPTYVPDLARTCLDLVIDGESGIWHLTSGEALSWLQFGRKIAGHLDLDASRVRSADPSELGWRAKRPRHAALGSERGIVMPSLSDALIRHAHIRRADCR